MAIISVVYILLCLASPIVVISLIVFIIAKRNNAKGEKHTSFDVVIKSIYVYLCLGIFLCMSIVSAIYAVNTSLDYFLPEVNIDEETSDVVYVQNEDCVNMITSIGTLAISIPMFVYHIKLSKEER